MSTSYTAKTATIRRGDFSTVPARIARGKSRAIEGAPTDQNGHQMAAFLARLNADGAPLIVIGLVYGSEQTTLTLDPSESDNFCNMLADAVLWQNEQLRQKAGQMVH